jgi:hypothetical protein
MILCGSPVEHVPEPPGWTVTSGALGGVPDEWRSIDTRSFEVDGKNGGG